MLHKAYSARRTNQMLERNVRFRRHQMAKRMSLATYCGTELGRLCQKWPARPVSLQRKCNNLKEHLHDNPSHSSKCVNLSPSKFRLGRSVLSND